MEGARRRTESVVSPSNNAKEEPYGENVMRIKQACVLISLAGVASALFALLASDTIPAQAQTGNSSLGGMVVYRGGDPAEARLWIGHEGHYRQTTCKTRGGKNVGYKLNGVIQGRYEVVVTAPGAQPRRI